MKTLKITALIINLILFGIGNAQAFTITVNSPSGGSCSFSNAILAANTGDINMSSGCPRVPDGDDTVHTIILPANQTFSFERDFNSNIALPFITSEIIIEGNGSILERSDAVTTPPIPRFAFFQLGRSGNVSGNLTLNDLTLTKGISLAADGGAILVTQSSTLTLNRCTLSDNEAAGDSGGRNGSGGAITITPTATAIINSSTISGNRANEEGGAIFNQGLLTVTNSTIDGNTANFDGGGIFNVGTLTISNSTISGNISTLRGGGIAVSNGTAEIINCTITENDSSNLGGDENGPGGGIAVISSAGTSSAIIRNSIISGNFSDDSSSQNCGVASVGGTTEIIDDGYNLSNDSSCPFTTANSSQMFDNDCIDPDLSDNGGPTFTHALLDPSDTNTPSTCTVNLAIDAGNDSICSSSPVNRTDQRGIPRPIDGDGINGAQCDIGSFEFGTPEPGFGMCFMDEVCGDFVDNNGDGIINQNCS